MKTKGILLPALLLVAGYISAQSYAGHSLPVKSGKTLDNKPRFLYMAGTIQNDLSSKRKELLCLDNALITVIDKKTKDTVRYNSNSSGQVIIKLPLNQRFTIIISKQGYTTKIVDVNTKVPVQRRSDYVLKFDAFLFESVYGIDVSVLKNPIARVWFNNPYNGFDYNYSYTDMVNERLKKEYLAFYNENTVKIPIETSYKPVIITIKQAALIADNRGASSNAPVIVFEVQLIATRTPRQLESVYFRYSGLANEVFSQGLYKYTVGDFATLDEAEMKKAELKKLGYTDAFVVALYYDHRIKLSDARKLVDR